jgi:hypothetical protein
VRAASEQKGKSEHAVERQRVSAELLRCANQLVLRPTPLRIE